MTTYFLVALCMRFDCGIQYCLYVLVNFHNIISALYHDWIIVPAGITEFLAFGGCVSTLLVILATIITGT
jgi:hypothetical protein